MEPVWECFLSALPWALGGVLVFSGVFFWASREKPVSAQTELEQSPLTSGVVVWIKDHIVFVATLGLFVFAVLKVMVVVADTPTALAVLQSQGAVTVTLGVLTGEVGTLMGIVLVLTWRWFRNAPTTRSAVVRVQALVFTFGIAMGLVPCPNFFQMALLLLLMTIIGVPHRRPGIAVTSGARARFALDSFVMLWILLVVFQGVLSDDVWLPAEVIEKTDGTTLTGYVLSEDQSWVPLLLEEARTVVRIEFDQVESRKICVPENERLDRTLMAMRDAREEVADCPTGAHH